MFTDMKSFETVCFKWAAEQKSYKKFCLTFVLMSFLHEGVISHPLIGLTVEQLGISTLSLTYGETVFPFTVKAKRVSVLALCLGTLY